MDSRQSVPSFPLSRHDRVSDGPTARNADRAVLYDFRRFPAGIYATSNPPSQGERLGLGFRLASGLVDREASGNLIRLPLGPHPVAVLQRPGEPSTVLAPLDLEQAGLGIGKDPDPVPAPVPLSSGCVPSSFVAMATGPGVTKRPLCLRAP